jgi:transcriptional regulator with XRE-family HTH domain
MPMPPDLTRELVIDLRAWYEDHDVSQKSLARKLYITPQQLSEIFAGRNRPTGEQVLRIQEFLRTNMKTDFIDPQTKPRPTTNDPLQPKSLGQAKEMIEDLRAQLKGGAPLPAKPAAPVSPTAKAQAGGSGAGAPPTDRPNKTPMPASPETPKKALPVTADTPFKITEILKLENLDSLLLLLANPVHTPLQKSLIYQEVKARRNLVASRGLSLN